MSGVLASIFPIPSCVTMHTAFCGMFVNYIAKTRGLAKLMLKGQRDCEHNHRTSYCVDELWMILALNHRVDWLLT
jgi:hypothetical protein